MTEAEERILQNQVEIMWTLHYLLSKVAPDFIGKGGELDRMRDDLRIASQKSSAMIEHANR